MKPITYSWIGLSAASPLIFLVCACALGVFHSYRRYWRSVDLFLLAIFVQELLMALQVFVFSLLSLVKPSTGVVCGMLIWSLSATRTLQAATVTSLLVDRALTSQWPYRYRFSVRRHQIRYHLVVLATMAALVGVAAILARPSESAIGTGTFDQCQFLPHNLHIRLALFLLSLSGLLVVISGVSVCVVQASRGCKPSDLQDMAPITHGTTGSSTNTNSSSRSPGGKALTPAASSASTTSSASSGRLGMQSASSTTDLVTPPLRVFHKRGNSKTHLRKAQQKGTAAEFRWGTSLVVSFICYFTNHLPYMGLLIMGTFFPTVLPAWPMENLSLWLSLLEGLLLPLALGICDKTFGEAVVLSCGRDKRPPSPPYEEPSAPFRPYMPKDEITKSFPLTNGSLFSSLLNMNVDNPLQSGNHYNNRTKAHLNVLRMGTGIPSEIRDPMVGVFRGSYHPSDLRISPGSCHPSDLRISPGSCHPSDLRISPGSCHPSDLRISPGSCHPSDLRISPDSYGRLFYQSSESTSISPETHCGHSLYSDPLNKAASTDSSLKASEDDHIYATLSETFGSLSSISDEYLGDNPRCPSATTVANDDFEYHGPQDGSCDTSLQPCELGNESVEYVSAYNTAMSPNTALVNDIPLKDRLSFLTSEDIYEEESPSSSFRSCSSVPSEVNTSLSSEFMKSIASYCPSNIVRPSSPRLGYVNRAFVRDIEETLHRPLPSVPEEGTLTRKHRSSSLSMNDLDQIEPEEEDEMMFILPVKSKSMLSLYRLYLAEDEPTGTTNLHYSLEISKSESDLTSPYRKISFQNLSPVQEIYRKKRVPKSAASRIRRQHKIQRAKGLQNKTRPIIKIRDPEIYQYSKSDKSPANTEENCTKSRDNGSGSSSSEEPPTKLEVQLAVMNKNKRKNGIITITDPSVLSVEELVKVLNRASGSSDPHDKDRGKGSDPNAFCSVSYPVTEYKKIFVSEYI